MFRNLSKNLIPIAIIIAGLLAAGALIYINQGPEKEAEILSPQAAAEKATAFINQAIQEDVTVSLLNVSEESGVYKIHIKIDGNEYDSYVTKDGKFLFSSAPYNLDEQSTPEEITKSDTPDVKLFVMSYCPYGLQAQKMFLPVYNLLKDKAEMGIYFVDYIMHEKEEIDENLRQYCVQKVEADKYYAYLSCFVIDGDFDGCLAETKIDKGILGSCMSETDSEYNVTAQYNDKSTWLNGMYPKFDVHSDLNEKYGVQGSPTVVINDQIVNINSRSPEKFKEAVCQVFNVQPEECSQKLSEDVFSPGFGLEKGSSGGSCQ